MASVNLQEMTSLDVSCPYCRAKVGRACTRSTSGLVANYSHEQRRAKLEGFKQGYITGLADVATTVSELKAEQSGADRLRRRSA
jgi:hypothetical protein